MRQKGFKLRERSCLGYARGEGVQLATGYVGPMLCVFGECVKGLSGAGIAMKY